jgi:hypothetical protein
MFTSPYDRGTVGLQESASGAVVKVTELARRLSLKYKTEMEEHAIIRLREGYAM